MAGKDGANSTRVFVSYSRRDQTFVGQLATALSAASFFVDFDLGGDAAKIEGGIAPTDAWQDRLRTLIAAADVVIFVVSPDSATSPVCDWEIGEAQSLGKRLIPVLWRAIDFAGAPQKLAALNVAISFEGEFEVSLKKLVAAIETDIDWLREGRRLTTLATRWRDTGEPESQLLRSAEATAAETWAARRPSNAPQPPEILFKFLNASRLKEDEDLRRLRTVTARGYVAQTQQAVNDGEPEEAIRLAATGAILSDDVGFTLAPELWDAVAPAIFRNRLLGVIYTAPVNGEKSARETAPRHVEFLGNVDRLFAVSASGAGIVWKVRDASRAIEIDPGRPIEIAAASFDGSMIATISDRNRLAVWDANSGHLLWSIEKEFIGRHLQFSRDGALLWTQIGAFNATSGKLVKQVMIHSWKMCVSPDGTKIATGDWNRDGVGTEVVILDAANGKPRGSIPLRKNNVTHLEFASNSKSLLILYEDHNIAESRATEFGENKYEALIVDAESRKILCSLLGHENHINGAAFDHEGARVVTTSDDRTIRVWDALTGAELSRRSIAPFRGMIGAYGGAHDVCFLPCQPVIFCATSDGRAELWHSESGQRIAQLTHMRRPKTETRLGDDSVRAVQFDRTGRRLLTVGEDGTVNIWHGALSPQTLSLEGHISHVTFVALSADARWIATIEAQSTLRVFDGTTGGLCATLHLTAARSAFGEARDGASAVCWFSRDGSKLIAASDNGEYSRKFYSEDRAAASVQVWHVGSWVAAGEVEGQGAAGGFLDASERFEKTEDRERLRDLLGEDAAPPGALKARIQDALRQFWTAEEIEASKYASSCLLSDDGTLVLQSSWHDSQITVWDVAKKEKIASFEGRLVDAPSVWTDDNSRLLIVRGGAICIVALPDGRLLFQLDEENAQCACVSRDGSRLGVGFRDGTARVYDISRTAAMTASRSAIVAASIKGGVGVPSPRERKLPSMADAPSDLHEALLPLLSPEQVAEAESARTLLMQPWADACYRPSSQVSAARSRWSPALEALRLSMVQHCLENLFEGDARKGLQAHEAERIAHALTIAALEALTRQRVEASTPGHDPTADDVSSYLGEVLEIVEDVHHSPLRVGAEAIGDDKRGPWRVDIQPLWSIKNKKYELFDVRALAGVAERYLRANYRSPSFDRLIVRLLIAGEMYAFGDTVYHNSLRSSERALTLQLMGAWLVTPLIVLAAGGFGLAYALREGIVGQWANWAGFAVGAFFGAIGMMLPGIVGGELRRELERRAKSQKLLAAMANAYLAVPEDGPFSAAQVRVSVDKAATLGTIWLPALFSVLEDIQARATGTATGK